MNQNSGLPDVKECITRYFLEGGGSYILLACLDECLPCSARQTKGIFLEADFYELWRKEMVDAFIKYGNLLNGLWQSHWRSLFRCRWLPPWLLLSLAELPVREKGAKTPSCFPLTDSQSRQLSVWIRDGLTALLLPSNKFSIKAPGKSEHRKENKPSISMASWCSW